MDFRAPRSRPLVFVRSLSRVEGHDGAAPAACAAPVRMFAEGHGIVGAAGRQQPHSLTGLG